MNRGISPAPLLSVTREGEETVFEGERPNDVRVRQGVPVAQSSCMITLADIEATIAASLEQVAHDV